MQTHIPIRATESPPFPGSEAVPNVQRLIDFYHALTPATLQKMAVVYSEQAYFRDPFNEVHELAAIRAIFEKMFEKLHEPRFVVTQVIQQENEVVLIWDFMFRMKSWRPQVARTIHGLSHIRFAPDGRVNYHVDYWDAAKELYEKLPLIGGIMRWLRKQLADG